MHGVVHPAQERPRLHQARGHHRQQNFPQQHRVISASAVGTVGRGEQIRDEVEQASREGLVDGAQAFWGNIYDSRLKDAMIALAQLWNRVPLLGCDLGKIQLPQRPLDALVTSSNTV